MAGEIIISITYGLDVLPHDDPYIEAAEISVQALLEALIPGKFFVDSISIMKYIPHWIPGATFKKQAKMWREYVDRMRNLPFDALLKSMVCPSRFEPDDSCSLVLTSLGRRHVQAILWPSRNAIGAIWNRRCLYRRKRQVSCWSDVSKFVNI